MSKDPLYLVTNTPDGYQHPPRGGAVIYDFLVYDKRCDIVDVPRELTVDAVELLCCLFDVTVITSRLPFPYVGFQALTQHSTLTDVISDEHFEDDARLEADTLTWMRNAR